MSFINRSPLNYIPFQENPIRITKADRPPTSGDYKNYVIGDEWWDTSLFNFWKLVNKGLASADWRLITGTSPTLVFFTPNSGGAVNPDITGNVNLIGASGITVVGTPGTNTLTIQPTSGGSLVTELTGNSGGAVPATLNNINVVGTATSGINTVGTPGTSTLTLSMNSPYSDGDFEFSTSVAGTTRTVEIANNDNTNLASSARLNIDVAGSGAGDPFVTFGVTGAQSYAIGIDNSASDTLKITNSTTPSLGTAIIGMNNAGAITFDEAYTFPTTDGTVNQVLTTDGAGTVSWSSIASAVGTVNIQTFTSSGTYTPTAGMKYCLIEVLGAGGAGGGNPATAATLAAAGGGGAGEYAKGVFSAATIGASQAVTIGAGGTGVVGGVGNNGGNSSVGILISAFGGRGAIASLSSVGISTAGGLGGTGGAGGSIRTPGQPGLSGLGLTTPTFAAFVCSGVGGSSQYGAGGISANVAPGNNGLGRGSGGSGSSTSGSGPAQAGGNGTSGIVIITEFIS